MYALVAAVILSGAALTQASQESDVASAGKSPITLARYLESHSTVDWEVLRTALGLEKSQYWFAPCGGNAPANEARCSVETVTVANPGQVIVIIRGGDFSFTEEYLRYLRGANRGWKFAGEYSAEKRFGPSNHALVQFGRKPFLMISSNHSEYGVASNRRLKIGLT